MAARSDSSSGKGADPYLGSTVEDMLEQLAARTPAPGGGAAAALTCAMAAGLVEMATSFASAQGLESVHERAHSIREEVSGLA
jgi:formiminotetrahydrofolate cyclodeaminase